MVHFKALSVYFVLCVIVGSSFAAPEQSKSLVSKHDANSHNNVFPVELQESIKQFTREVEKSFKSFTKNFQYLFQNLNSIFHSTVEKGFVNVATWAMDIGGRFEFLILADGSHFMTPLSSKSELEYEYRIVSVAVSKLLRNLKTMEWTDKLITNATRKMVTGDLETQFKEMKSSPEKAFRTILHSYIEAMDHVFEADHELSAEYAKQKSAAKQHVRPDQKMHEPLFKLWEGGYKHLSNEEIKSFLKDKEVVREAYVNKLFMKHAVKNFLMIFNSTRHYRFALARALIHKAQSSNFDSKVNQIYHKALVQAGALEYLDKDDDVIADVLFGSIEKALVSDNALHEDIHHLVKEVEGSTVYDFDMLRIDFAPL